MAPSREIQNNPVEAEVILFSLPIARSAALLKRIPISIYHRQSP